MPTQPEALFKQYTNNNVVIIDFSSRGERFTLRSHTFIKRQGKAGNKFLRIQSALCEDALREENGRRLNIVVVKIYRRVVSTEENRSVKKYNEQVVTVE